jgi:hypothetical protein
MKHALHVLCGVISALLCSAPIWACTITYDFENIPTGFYTEDQFNSFFEGIRFDNVNVMGGANDGFTVTTVDYRDPSLTADFSGHVVMNNPYNVPANSTMVYLDTPTDYVSITMGDFGYDEDTLFLYAFDSTDRQVGYSAIINPSTSFAGITLSVQTVLPTISSIEFFGPSSISNNSILWDNLTIGGDQGSPVPEPATLMLLGAGLLGLAGVRRKVRQASSSALKE